MEFSSQWTLLAVGAVLFTVAIIAAPFVLYALIMRSERKAEERLRATGIRCTAYVKSFRRVSMTQHRVLLEIQFPSGSVGREYMLSKLSETWLADVCALSRPVRVVALPDAATIVFE